MTWPFPSGRNLALASASLVLALLCVGCGGGTSHTSISTPPPPPVTPAPVGGIQPSFFGFQCGTGSGNCPNETWPSSVAQPGTLRLWDAGVDWNDIESTTPGQYDFSTLDGWLDTIAAQNKASVWAVPVNVIYTFGFVSCAEVASCRNGSQSSCTSGTLATFKGCIVPPDDFTGTLSGSPSFNSFVTALVQHCSPAGNCTKDLIKNYEMWNEPNNASFWHENTPGGTGETEIYQMVYAAVPIIRQNVNNVTIMTMASTVDATYTADWLKLENQYPPAGGGTLSDVVVWHQYLSINGGGTEVAPDDPSNISRLNDMLSAIQGVLGWASKPWEITETGFQSLNPPYNCTAFSTNDCIGQMVRWQLIVLSGNASGLDWYSWNKNIGSQSNYAAAWSYMMKNLLGGTFTSPCSSSGATWTCGFKETSGKTAQWVWSTNSSGGSSYSVPSGYSNAISFDVNTPSSPSTSTPVSAGQSINVTTMPTLLEQ